MSETIDQILKTAKDWMAILLDHTQKGIDLGKIEFELIKAKSEIEKQYAGYGRIAYQLEKGALNRDEEIIATALSGIDKLEEAISMLKEEKQMVREQLGRKTGKQESASESDANGDAASSVNETEAPVQTDAPGQSVESEEPGQSEVSDYTAETEENDEAQQDGNEALDNVKEFGAKAKNAFDKGIALAGEYAGTAYGSLKGGLEKAIEKATIAINKAAVAVAEKTSAKEETEENDEVNPLGKETEEAKEEAVNEIRELEVSASETAETAELVSDIPLLKFCPECGAGNVPSACRCSNCNYEFK